MNRPVKSIVLLLVLSVASFAQGLAPESIANHLANHAVTGTPGAAPFSILFTPSQTFRLATAGAPLTQPMEYTWTKTGADTATLVETDSTRTQTTALTFTGPLTATFRTTSTAQISAIV